MSRKLYQKVAPHLKRVARDGGVATNNINDLLLLQRSNEELKDYIKVAFCPELYGNKFRQDVSNAAIKYLSKGYSAEKIGQDHIARRNLSTYTEDFDNTFWTKTECSIVANATISPNGTLTADKFVESANNLRHRISLFTSPLVAGQNVTFSVYMKAAERNYGCLYIDFNSDRYCVVFDLINGVFTNQAGTDISKSITNIGNGWFRIQVTRLNNTTYTYFDLGSCNTGNPYYAGSYPLYQGDGVSGVYIWGAQIEAGSTATSYQRVLDAATYDGVKYDLTQIADNSQPYLDKIAPTERLSVKNPNGGSRYLKHPTVSFGATDEWTVETVLNWNGLENARIQCSTTSNGFVYLASGNKNIAIWTGTQLIETPINSFTKFIGKNVVIHIFKKVGSIQFFANGTFLYDNTTIPYDLDCNMLLHQSIRFGGYLFSNHIFSKALSPTQVLERASILRSIFPEIPFTRIGEQIWSVRNFEAVVTPQGTLIPEMQANGNVEKITNAADREFSSDTGFWTKIGSTTIDNNDSNICNINSPSGSYSAIEKNNFLTPGKWYKVQFQILNVRSGSVSVEGSLQTYNSVGTYTLYYQSTGAFFALKRSTVGLITDIDIDNVSVQEIGWSGSQELYNGIYAQTSGTDEQKTYAAVKAAAMWCHYGNSVDNGAIYGKLYNWFAVKLLQMDIDKFNEANPSTPFGWRVPTQADFNTLVATLGSASVAGGKMKMPGTAYWESPNTGANNSSGFSGLPNGYRHYVDGSFGGIFLNGGYMNLDSTANKLILQSTGASADIGYGANTYGRALRLIKT